MTHFMKDEGWSGIDIQLKRRSNLIPNLMETVKGYMQHEKEVLTEVTELRNLAKSAATPGERIKAESALAHEIKSTVEGAEQGNLPELPADRKNDRARIKHYIDQIQADKVDISRCLKTARERPPRSNFEQPDFSIKKFTGSSNNTGR